MNQPLETFSTYQELHAQPSIWRAWAQDFDVQAVRDWVQRQDFNEIWFCGAGTSAYIGDIIVAGLEGSCVPMRSVPTTDIVARPNAILTGKHPLVVNFGRSGNSAETLGTLSALDALLPQAPRLNITCNANGALAHRQGEAEQYTILLPQETHDAGFAMTSSFSTMLLTALSIFDPSMDIKNALPLLADTLENMLPSFAELANEMPERVVYVGSGPLAFAAREAALKSLELTAGKIPSLWDSSLGFRHGPKSFVLSQTMIVVFTSTDAYTRQYDLDLIHELSSQFPDNKVISLGVECELSFETGLLDVWNAAVYVAFAQLQGVLWSDKLCLNVDNPFDGRGTLSRVVDGVKLYEVRP